MKIITIGDHDFVVGFKFGGVDGIVIKNKSETLNVVKELIEKKNIGIIIIQEKFYNEVKDVVDELLEGRLYPVIVSVPGKEGKITKMDVLSKLIKRAIGVEIKFGEEK